MSPRRGSKPRRTDRLVVSRNVTLTLSQSSWDSSSYELVSGESSAEELVDGQWEPVGLQEVLGPEETQQELWESVVIVRRLGKCCSEL
jgi:hypothetical protein